MTTIRSAGIYGGTAPGQVDTEALADLIRRRTAELAAVAERFAHLAAAATDGDNELKETDR